MSRRKSGQHPHRSTNAQPDPEPPGHDPTLLALEDLVAAAEQLGHMITRLSTRAEHIRACRLEGLEYRQIVMGEDLPLIAGFLTENIQRLEAAGTRFRQAEARALHDEGMTMEEIGRLFGLTRQRISALIRAASAAPPDQVLDKNAAPAPPQEEQASPSSPKT